MLIFDITNAPASGIPRAEVQVTIDLLSNLPSCSYKSNIIVISSTGAEVSIHINLIVSDSDFLPAFLIFCGVLINLLMFGIREVQDERNRLRITLDETEEKLTSSYDVVRVAYDDERVDGLRKMSNYVVANTEFGYLISGITQLKKRIPLP